MTCEFVLYMPAEAGISRDVGPQVFKFLIHNVSILSSLRSTVQTRLKEMIEHKSEGTPLAKNNSSKSSAEKPLPPSWLQWYLHALIDSSPQSGTTSQSPIEPGSASRAHASSRSADRIPSVSAADPTTTVDDARETVLLSQSPSPVVEESKLTPPIPSSPLPSSSLPTSPPIQPPALRVLLPEYPPRPLRVRQSTTSSILGAIASVTGGHLAAQHVKRQQAPRPYHFIPVSTSKDPTSSPDSPSSSNSPSETRRKITSDATFDDPLQTVLKGRGFLEFPTFILVPHSNEEANEGIVLVDDIPENGVLEPPARKRRRVDPEHVSPNAVSSTPAETAAAAKKKGLAGLLNAYGSGDESSSDGDADADGARDGEDVSGRGDETKTSKAKAAKGIIVGMLGGYASDGESSPPPPVGDDDDGDGSDDGDSEDEEETASPVEGLPLASRWLAEDAKEDEVDWGEDEEVR